MTVTFLCIGKIVPKGLGERAKIKVGLRLEPIMATERVRVHPRGPDPPPLRTWKSQLVIAPSALGCTTSTLFFQALG